MPMFVAAEADPDRSRRRALATMFALSAAGCALRTGTDTLAHGPATLLLDLAERQRFQGAVVLMQHGRVAYAGGFGHADVQQRVPFTPDTPMDGASIAKPMTAGALLALVDQGRLDLESPVQALLPEFPYPTTRWRHLLAHSAGLPDFDWFDPPRSPAGAVRTNNSHLALLARERPALALAPGSGFQYDNLAYDLVAMAVEKLGGQPYAEAMAERYFRPLSMRSAFVRPGLLADWPAGVVRTRGYRRGADGWRDHDALDFEGFHGASNVMLSARDLAQFMAGYRQALGEAVLRKATAAARLDDGRTTGISLGCWFAADDGQRYYYTGSHQGFYCFGYRDERRNTAVAWMSNDTTPLWLRNALSRALIAVTEGREPESLAEPVPRNAASGSVDGRYRVASVGDVLVRSEGRRLFVTVNRVEYRAFGVEPGVRYVPGLDAVTRFVAEPNGRPPALAWDSVFAAPSIAPRE
jgi:CubicO group peptidase (beta-lactamase class C family)